MLLKNLFLRIAGSSAGKRAETVNYDTIFKGEAAVPLAAVGSVSNFLPGLRPVKNDIDLYFKDVFAGPVF